MLLEHTMTLNEFEEHLGTRKITIQKEIEQLGRDLNVLQNSLRNTPTTAKDEENNIIENPEFTKLKDDFEAKKETYQELHENQEFIQLKLVELESIEEHSQGKVDKEKDEVTLNLNDLVKFGIEVD